MEEGSVKLFSVLLRSLGGDDGAFLQDPRRASGRCSPAERSLLSSSRLRPGAASPFAVLGLNGGRVHVTASGGVASQDRSRAAADANADSEAYAALAPTQSFGSLIRSATITSTGGVNVIRVHSLNYDHSTLTLEGGANDVFIFNVLGDFSFNHSTIELRGGLTADHVLFNFPQAGPDGDLQSAGKGINSTFLAPLHSLSHDNAAVFNGAVIARNVDVPS